MDREALAWAAGFFDGEGNVRTYTTHWWSHGRKVPGRGMTAGITQVDDGTLERFQRTVGLGRVRGPYPERNPKWRPRVYWSVQQVAEVHLLCWLLWLWLGETKRHQFHQAFESYRALEGIGRRR